jgi:carboxylesterase type B
MDSTPSFFSYQVRSLLPNVPQTVDGDQPTLQQSLALAWQPRIDGTFLVDSPQKLVQQGVVARIPLVSGDCDDEGTLYSLSQLNVT